MKAMMIAAALALAAATVTTAVAPAGANAQTATASPQKIALARQIFELQGGAKTFQAMVDSVQTAVAAQMIKSLPPERQAQAAQVQAASREMMQAFIPKMVDWEVSFFAVNYSEAELSQLLAFYQSPTGQDVIAKAPLMAQQLAPFMASQLQLIRTGAVERYCAETRCPAEMKTAMLTPQSSNR